MSYAHHFKEQTRLFNFVDETCLSELNTLTKNAHFPLVQLEDYVRMFDSAVIPLEPLQLVFYHLLGLKDLGAPNLEERFNQIFLPCISKVQQQAVQAVWRLDLFGHSKNCNEHLLLVDLLKYSE